MVRKDAAIVKLLYGDNGAMSSTRMVTRPVFLIDDIVQLTIDKLSQLFYHPDSVYNNANGNSMQASH